MPHYFLNKIYPNPAPPSTTVFKSISPNISDFLWTHYLPKRSRRFSVTQKQTNKQAYFTEVLKQVWSTVRKQEVRHSEGSFSFAWRHCPVYKDSALHLPQEVSLFLLTVELMAVLGRKSTVKKSLILIHYRVFFLLFWFSTDIYLWKDDHNKISRCLYCITSREQRLVDSRSRVD